VLDRLGESRHVRDVMRVVRNRIRRPHRTTFYRISRLGSRVPKEIIAGHGQAAAHPRRRRPRPRIHPCRRRGVHMELVADAHTHYMLHAHVDQCRTVTCTVCRARKSLLLGAGAESARLSPCCTFMTRQVYGNSETVADHSA
jgi:hypothetical protein